MMPYTQWFCRPTKIASCAPGFKLHCCIYFATIPDQVLKIVPLKSGSFFTWIVGSKFCNMPWYPFRLWYPEYIQDWVLFVLVVESVLVFKSLNPGTVSQLDFTLTLGQLRIQSLSTNLILFLQKSYCIMTNASFLHLSLEVNSQAKIVQNLELYSTDILPILPL